MMCLVWNIFDVVFFFLNAIFVLFYRAVSSSTQWGTAGAEIKDPSVESPELKGSLI